MRMRLIVIGIFLISVWLSGCGRSQTFVSDSAAQSTSTATADLTATILYQTAVVEGATKEAEYLAVEQRFADETATSLAEPYETMLPWPTDLPVTPSPTWEYRLFDHLECTTDEPGPAMFVTNCWYGEINNKKFKVYGYGSRNKAANNKIVGGQIGVIENDVPMGNHFLPSNTRALTIVKELSPYLVISVGDQYQVLFNLETYQWANLDGTPIPVTATPTSTSEPTIATPTPAGGITVTSLTLFDADTDQPLIGFDPMDTPTVLDFVALGTRRLNIRANTSPATVGSVRFSLDGAPYRIEGGAPYALLGNTGSDYAAWTPSAGQHQLVVTAFSGANATGTQGGSFTLDFTVVDTATATAAPATATATGIPASITPVPATPTSTGSTSMPSTTKNALFVVGDATTLNTNDTAIQALLVGEGYTVSLKSAAQ